jgi:murein DD-endopeptidase MepM/ murein hydrolase activator NlpD
MLKRLFRVRTRAAGAAKPKRGRVNVLVVPHGGGHSRTVYVHGVFLGLLFAASVAVIAFAVVMVSGYWKNILNLSQLAVLENRDKEEAYKLEVMEKGITDLDGKLGDVGNQYERLVKGHRLTEVRPPEALLPAREGPAGDSLADAEGRVARVAKNLATVRRKFDADVDGLTYIPSIIPTPGWLYRDFGNTVSPFTGRVEMHRGLDVVAPRGTPIVATAAGVVTFSDLQEPYGLVVELDHGNGFVTRYAHNMRNVARAGAKVKRGQVIAYVGSTGLSSCTHVHYEVVRYGVPVNPRYFILREPAPAMKGDRPEAGT